MRNIIALIIVFVIIGLFGIAFGCEPVDNADVGLLHSLSPLPKTLFIWGVSHFQSLAILDEWVRITHGCPITLAWSSDEKIRACAEMLVKYPEARLSMTYSPLVKYYNLMIESEDVRPGSEEWRAGITEIILDPAGSGGLWDEEMASVIQRLSHIALIFHEFDIDLIDDGRSVVMLDHEGGVINDDTVDMLTAKLNWMYDKFESHGHDTFYYNYRNQRPDSRSGTGWSTWSQLPEDVQSRWASCSMYWPSQLYMNREILKHTVDYNLGMDVVPVINFGWEWVYNVNQRTGKMSRKSNFDYDTGMSFVVGMDLNIRWRPEPNEYVPFVFSWPGIAHNEFFWDHFVAYVRGATFCGRMDDVDGQEKTFRPGGRN